MSWRETAQARRPTNYVRNAYHIGNGVFVGWLVLHVLSPLGMVIVAGSCALFAWTAEISRRMSPSINRVLLTVWGKTAHPHEQTEVNSGTWIVTAMFILGLLFDNVEAAVGIIVCGFGDPVAALVGRRFGRRHIGGGRTLEGSAAFVAVGFAAVFALYSVYASWVAPWQIAVIALSASVAGAVAEARAPVDDNLAIPIASSVAGYAAMSALGLQPSAGWLFEGLRL